MTAQLSAVSHTAKGTRTRDRIVALAAALIYERGVAATTLEDVRTRAGVSSSQLYHYFRDKRDLVRAVVAHQTDAIVGAQERTPLESIAALRTWRDEVVAYARLRDGRGGCPLGSLGSELAESDPEGRSAVADGFDRWEAEIRSGLRAMHRRGVLVATADPDALALATLAALQGGLLLNQVQRDVRPLVAALDAMIDLIELRVAPPAAS